tara:strand:- start:2371 stop:3405 length:1035 start_codon:yes stop_codon:yes gene_type:complete
MSCQSPSYFKKSLGWFSPSDEAILVELMSAEPTYYTDNKCFHLGNPHIDLFREDIGMDHLEGIWNNIHASEYFLDITPKINKKELILTKEKEVLIFLQYNYSRFIVHKLQKKRSLRRSEKMRLLKWYKTSCKLRKTIIEANLGLCLAMAKKVAHGPDVTNSEIVSAGHLALLRSINKFDIGRGFKFSTYACRSILKEMYRVCQNAQKRRIRFPVSHDEDFLTEKQANHQDLDAGFKLEDLRKILADNKAGLNKNERCVIHHRFPFNPYANRLTLVQIGRIIGLTKERVRQLQNKALDKLRKVLDPIEIEKTEQDREEYFRQWKERKELEEALKLEELEKDQILV